ncbi:MAG: class I SAM-dependent DNA methyltransferase [Chitinophagaceae bacterium]
MKAFNAYAQYYDLLYENKNYRDEAAYVSNLIKEVQPFATSLLNLGCGTGKHDLQFVNLGYNVCGIDLSEDMITQAARLLKDQIRENKACFSQGDVRNVRLNKKFDAVVSLFHVISYQNSNQDIADMLQTAAAHLETGGTFIFDCWYGPAVLTDPPVVRVRRMHNEDITVTRIAEPVLHPNKNIVDVNYEILVSNNKDSAERHIIRETHPMRYLFLPELILFLNQAGFNILNQFEWMTRKEPNSNSWNIVLICKYTSK